MSEFVVSGVEKICGGKQNQTVTWQSTDPTMSGYLKRRGQRDEKGCEEVAKDCYSCSRPTTSQTQLD